MELVVLTLLLSYPFFTSSPIIDFTFISLSFSFHFSNTNSLTKPSFHCFFSATRKKMEGKGKRSLKEKAKKEEEVEEEEGFGSCDDDRRKKGCSSSAIKKGSNTVSGGVGSVSSPACQAEKCTVNLAEAKRYHRRHKVCEHHSKAPVVIVGGLRQRFCQQCSRFHELSEFDDAKRSCRTRLAGHNERRRKSSSESQGEGSSRKVGNPQLKDNHCRQADQAGRILITLPDKASYKHFQIR